MINRVALDAAKLEIEAFAPKKGVAMNKRTAHDVLDACHGNSVFGESFDKEAALQQLLADILLLDVMQDEKPDDSDRPHQYEYRNKLKNQVRAELRQALKDYFMGGDVGVDDGDSE